MIHVVTFSFKTLRLARYSFSCAPLSELGLDFFSPFSVLIVSVELGTLIAKLVNAFDSDPMRAPKPANPENPFFA